MSTAKSILSTLITAALLVLLFWGLSKFILWFPTINSIIFYFLTFILFFESIRLFTTMIQSISQLRQFIKTTGISGSHVFKIIFIAIILVVCLVYIGQIILTHNDAYSGLQYIGLFALCLFILQSSLSILTQMFSPI